MSAGHKHPPETFECCGLRRSTYRNFVVLKFDKGMLAAFPYIHTLRHLTKAPLQNLSAKRPRF